MPISTIDSYKKQTLKPGRVFCTLNVGYAH